MDDQLRSSKDQIAKCIEVFHRESAIRTQGEVAQSGDGGFAQVDVLSIQAQTAESAQASNPCGGVAVEIEIAVDHQLDTVFIQEEHGAFVTAAQGGQCQGRSLHHTATKSQAIGHQVQIRRLGIHVPHDFHLPSRGDAEITECIQVAANHDISVGIDRHAYRRGGGEISGNDHILSFGGEIPGEGKVAFCNQIPAKGHVAALVGV